MPDKIIIEGYTRVTESAKIEGVALIPTISRNHNLYTKAELERFDGVTVPLNWEHDGNKVIGQVTFRYNPSQETVFYEGEITDPSASILAKNKLLYTSIEAQPTSVQKVCNGTNDCFSMPFGLVPEALALTETPGILQTSVKVIERYLDEFKEHTDADHEFIDKYGASEIIHKTEVIKNPHVKKDESMDGVGDSSDLTQKILDYLNLEICEECGDLHLKKKNK